MVLIYTNLCLVTLDKTVKKSKIYTVNAHKIAFCATALSALFELIIHILMQSLFVVKSITEQLNHQDHTALIYKQCVFSQKHMYVGPFTHYSSFKA